MEPSDFQAFWREQVRDGKECAVVERIRVIAECINKVGLDGKEKDDGSLVRFLYNGPLVGIPREVIQLIVSYKLKYIQPGKVFYYITGVVETSKLEYLALLQKFKMWASERAEFGCDYGLVRQLILGPWSSKQDDDRTKLFARSVTRLIAWRKRVRNDSLIDELQAALRRYRENEHGEPDVLRGSPSERLHARIRPLVELLVNPPLFPQYFFQQIQQPEQP